MCESRDGVRVACTRQNAGSLPKPVKNSTELRGTPGGSRNVPGATTFALVMFVFARGSRARLSHGLAFAVEHAATGIASTNADANRNLIRWSKREATPRD